MPEVASGTHDMRPAVARVLDRTDVVVICEGQDPNDPPLGTLRRVLRREVPAFAASSHSFGSAACKADALQEAATQLVERCVEVEDWLREEERQRSMNEEVSVGGDETAHDE